MTPLASILAASPQGQVWTLWALLVFGMVVLVFLLFGIVRRRLVRPMRHTPSDLTDAWTEAGRRMKAEAPGGEDEERP